MDTSKLSDQINSLERRLRRTQIALLCALLVPTLLALGGWANSQAKEPEVLRVKGLVVVDENGRDRVLIGAPMPDSATRKRKDTSTAIAILDEDGSDRLLLGETMGFVQNGRFVKRERGYSLLIHEPGGDERGGFGCFDAGKAVLALDRKRPDSDGIGMFVDDSLDFAGLMVNHKMKDGRYVQGMAFGIQKGMGFFNMDDPNGKRRLSIELPPSGDPAAKIFNHVGLIARDAFKKQ